MNNLWAQLMFSQLHFVSCGRELFKQLQNEVQAVDKREKWSSHLSGQFKQLFLIETSKFR